MRTHDVDLCGELGVEEGVGRCVEDGCVENSFVVETVDTLCILPVARYVVVFDEGADKGVVGEFPVRNVWWGDVDVGSAVPAVLQWDTCQSRSHGAAFYVEWSACLTQRKGWNERRNLHGL